MGEKNRGCEIQYESTYSINLWRSHPDKDNDDCYTGKDFSTLEEAREAMSNLSVHFDMAYYNTAHFVELDGAVGSNVYEVHPIPGAKEYTQDQNEWKQEIAMQAGMQGGCDAYNDAMGY